MIKEELGTEEVYISLIGLAGDNVVRYACILNDVYRAASRSGMGAVMGSKNLKLWRPGAQSPYTSPGRRSSTASATTSGSGSKSLMCQMLYDQGTWLLTVPANYEQGWFCWQNFQQETIPMPRN